MTKKHKLLSAMDQKPAIEGGPPAFSSWLPFDLPSIGAEEEEEVIDTLRSGWITMGPKVKRFEESFRDYVGAGNAAATNSCTAALHLCLAAMEIGPGDEVITTPVTFAATANVIIHQGATPVFADIEPDTLNIDPERIRDKVTDRTKAIVPVHMAGRPCRMEEIMKIADEIGIPVIEDAAHALGASYKGKKIGSISNFTCFSFYPTKNITAIEGGMVTSDDVAMMDKIRLLSLHGMDKDAWKRYSHGGTQHWEIVYPGYKYNMTDVQASVGIHQLEKLDSFLKIRERYVAIYNKSLAEQEEIELMQPFKDGVSSNHLYIIKLNLDKLRIGRDMFMQALKAENIGTGIHFRSLHLHPYYRDTFKFRPEDFPVANNVSDRIISLPLYPKMYEEDLITVVKTVKKLVNFYSKI